jgi:hypothetical protein
MISQAGLNGTQGNYLQVNPQKTEYQGTLFLGKVAESREYFEVPNGLGSIYYTSKSIVGDTSYLLGVKCVDPDGNIKMSEQLINPVYEDLNSVASRGVWAKNNIGPIIVILISILVVGGVLIGLYIVLTGEGWR